MKRLAKEAVPKKEKPKYIKPNYRPSASDTEAVLITDDRADTTEKSEPVVFLLWGSNARQKKALIHNKAHLVLECAHPSPLSAFHGFFGCGHFRAANEFLKKNGRDEIDWSKTL